MGAAAATQICEKQRKKTKKMSEWIVHRVARGE